MGPFALYLLKSAAWLTGFSLVYILLLRNERFFRINRFYLLAGIFASFLFPLISLHYSVEVSIPEVSLPDRGAMVMSDSAPYSTASSGQGLNYINLILGAYLVVIIILVVRLISQLMSLTAKISKNEILVRGKARIIKIPGLKSPFSFFRYIFIGSSVGESEAIHILNHEEVHVSQKHWFDLLLAEIVRTLQWANPFAWIYAGYIRQNHEFMADEVAMKKASDPEAYRAALLNQIFNSPVIALSNSFLYSNNKKRFVMMNKIIFSPYRKLKLLLVFPMVALIFYAFATPEYHFKSTGYEFISGPVSSDIAQKVIKGVVINQDGKTLEGANIVIKGTTQGTVSGLNGFFMLNSVPEDGVLVVSYIGYKIKEINPVFTTVMSISLMRDTVSLGSIGVPPPPPPPPPLSADGSKPLYVVDGKIKDDISAINPNDIVNVNVLKGYSAVKKYGEKGKDGVIEIETKQMDLPSKSEESSKNENTKSNALIMVEEMPMFPGGEDALREWIYDNIKVIGGIDRKTIEEPVFVVFVVGSTGKISDVRVEKSVNPLLDAEAIRVVKEMPDWKPGKQNGKPVDVYYQLPIDFSPIYLKGK